MLQSAYSLIWSQSSPLKCIRASSCIFISGLFPIGCLNIYVKVLFSLSYPFYYFGRFSFKSWVLLSCKYVPKYSHDSRCPGCLSCQPGSEEKDCPPSRIPPPSSLASRLRRRRWANMALTFIFCFSLWSSTSMCLLVSWYSNQAFQSRRLTFNCL